MSKTPVILCRCLRQICRLPTAPANFKRLFTRECFQTESRVTTLMARKMDVDWLISSCAVPCTLMLE
jgi:hypothetical protein